MEHLAIDLGARESQICVRSQDGTIVDERRYPTALLERYLAGRPRSRVIVESSSEAFAVADLAAGLGHEVRVVPAAMVRALGVGARRVKNDRLDARATSRASCQTELPGVHVPSPRARELRAIMTSRAGLIETRTKLMNTVRSWMRTQLMPPLKRGGTESFVARTREALLATSRGVPEHVERILRVIENVNAEIEAADREALELAEGNEVCVRLMTVPGVGPVTSVRFVAAVDELGRFQNAHELESYFGMTPGENITGFKGHRTHLTKAGSAHMRFVLVQAAWCAMRTRRGDPMVRWALQVARRRGRGVAAVALARKMAGILYAIWRDSSSYDPRRGATKTDGETGLEEETVSSV